MANDCGGERARRNTDQTKLDSSNMDYMTCLRQHNPALGGQENLNAAKPAMDKIKKDAETIAYIEKFVLGQLRREVANEQTMSVLSESVTQESERIKAEIDELKTEIRTEKRRFLDASPSTTTAVGGLYFTMQPDNQLLIAFLSCLGAFLLFMSILLLMNYIPVYYLEALSSAQRFQIIGLAWTVTAVVTYIGFFIFT